MVLCQPLVIFVYYKIAIETCSGFTKKPSNLYSVHEHIMSHYIEVYICTATIQVKS